MSAQGPKQAEGFKQDFIYDIFLGYSSKDKAVVLLFQSGISNQPTHEQPRSHTTGPA